MFEPRNTKGKRRWGKLLTLALLIPILSGGCITLKPRSQRPGASAVVLSSIPVRAWGDNTCGAGALTTVLNYFHSPATEDELNAVLKKGRHGGVVSIDLMLEARKRGFDAKLIKGTPQLVEDAIRAGTPPILMLRILNVPGQQSDLFHYIVVDGFDTEKNLARMQFGDGRQRWASLETAHIAPVGGGLQKAWEGTDFATLVVQPSGSKPREIQVELRNAVALEESGQLEAARQAYRELLGSDAGSSVAWTNLGNVEARLGNHVEAETAYREALRLDPANRDAANNLAWVLLQMNRLEPAEEMARHAESLSGPDDDLVLDTLAQVLEARGKCAEAVATWERAIEAVPSSRAESRTTLRQSADNACKAN